MACYMARGFLQRAGELKKEGHDHTLTILFVVVVGAILVWWLRSVKPKRRV
jgi:hypothetical protein